MLQTMRRHDGIGLAAPQVGKVLRLFVVDVEWTRAKAVPKGYVFFNPELELGPDRVEAEEGCLSLPGEVAWVERSSTVRVSALGLDGKAFTLTAEGLFARAIQHENDHLEGRLIA